jgi:hypothetical protein
MEDKKVPNSEQIRLRRVTELREFALAAFYPLTHSGDAVHLKRTENALAAVIPGHPLLGRLRNNRHALEGVSKPCGEAVTRGAVTPQVERLQRLEREHGYQRSPDEPKPWKKPWDK